MRSEGSMRPVAAVIAASLCLAACGDRPAEQAPAADAVPAPIKARQAMAAINADLGPVNMATPVEGGVDQIVMDIEIQSLEGPWRWWDTARRIINNGPSHVGQFEDLIYTVDPGDLVTVESPTYTNGSATALSYGATLLEIPVDDNGMDVDALERLVAAAGRKPKAIYTIPTFQNPSGVTLSLERRLRLLELARDWGSMILDDDPYGLLRFAGDPLPTLRELGGGDPLVFSVRTFSKIVAPGLRVGWVDTVPELQPLLINAKQAMDTCTNLPAQRLLAGFLTGGHLADHLVTQRAEYKRRKDAMHAALHEHFGGTARWTDPDGGFFLWVTLDENVTEDLDATALFDVALAEGVAFIPGAAFSPSGRFSDALRLCFASTPPDRIREGIARLRRAVDKLRP